MLMSLYRKQLYNKFVSRLANNRYIMEYIMEYYGVSSVYYMEYYGVYYGVSFNCIPWQLRHMVAPSA